MDSFVTHTLCPQPPLVHSTTVITEHPIELDSQTSRTRDTSPLSRTALPLAGSPFRGIGSLRSGRQRRNGDGEMYGRHGSKSRKRALISWTCIDFLRWERMARKLIAMPPFDDLARWSSNIDGAIESKPSSPTYHPTTELYHRHAHPSMHTLSIYATNPFKSHSYFFTLMFTFERWPLPIPGTERYHLAKSTFRFDYQLNELGWEVVHDHIGISFASCFRRYLSTPLTSRYSFNPSVGVVSDFEIIRGLRLSWDPIEMTGRIHAVVVQLPVVSAVLLCGIPTIPFAI